MTYLYLIVAIAFEVVATSALKQTEGFTRLWPSLLTFAGYGIAIYLLALCVRTIPVGIVYALWSGAGIPLIIAIAWFWFGEAIDTPGLIGVGLILAGVLVVNLFSSTISH